MSSPFDLAFLVFIFAPLLLTIGLVCWIAWRKSWSFSQRDAAAGILAAAVEAMPRERRDWGQAMSAELEQIEGLWARFWFALGCARVALFPPTLAAPHRASFKPFQRFGVNCGMLSVALPPLALPFLFAISLLADALFHGAGDSTSHVMPAGLIGACLIIGVTMLLSGLPLGLAGWYRRERFLWLSALGPCLSVVFLGHLWIFLYLFAGGPNGD